MLRTRFCLQCLHTDRSLLNAHDYAGHVYWASMASTLANIGQGRFEEAMEQARHQQEHWPCDDDLSIYLGPALEKAGRRDLANELFATAFTNCLSLLRQYPNSAGSHNLIAWLCARTRRELAAGLEHARKAVALSPDDHVSRDTLAEVLFQLGRREEAVAEMRKCIEQAPDRPYYRRQLKRMQEGDPSSDPTAESE